MSGLLDLVRSHPVRHFQVGDEVIRQGTPAGPMFVLLEGAVEILRDSVPVAKASTAGVVFGEMSVLLRCPHTATVRAIDRCSFAVVDDPRAFLFGSAPASFHIAQLLATRLDALNKYLVDVKRQYEGHDHLGMVDEVLETLMHRPKR
jgi:CRP/FNR family cyclic AMP-dependent transcriptional regulator